MASFTYLKKNPFSVVSVSYPRLIKIKQNILIIKLKEATRTTRTLMVP